METYDADFTVGRHGRKAVLRDGQGTEVLHFFGSGGVRDDRGKLGWSLQPSIRNLVAASLTDGRGGEVASELHRSRAVAAGRPLTAATILHPDRWHFVIKSDDPTLTGLEYGPLAGRDGQPPDPDNPSADCELLQDGVAIARCWPVMDEEWKLAGAHYEVLDDAPGLPEILLLFHGRYELWRPHHNQRASRWEWQ